MAQRTEQEETEFTVPAEKLTLYGTKNNTTNTAATTATTATAANSIAGITLRSSSPDPSSSCSVEQSVELLSSLECLSPPVTESTVTKRKLNRCFGCRKKVGLTGFRCRCGELFCGDHRYSDRHDCSYDYKAAGRKAIAEENPVVKAAKIVSI